MVLNSPGGMLELSRAKQETKKIKRRERLGRERVRVREGGRGGGAAEEVVVGGKVGSVDAVRDDGCTILILYGSVFTTPLRPGG